MAGAVIDDGQFWLPSHFLNDDDLLLHMNKENIVVDDNGGVLKSDLKLASKTDSFFPTEFPYEFSSFCSSNSALSSPGESVTTTTTTETESDDDDFFAALTRELARSSLFETHKLAAAPNFNAPEKLEKTCVLSRSPQSTLSGIGSWSGKSPGSSNGSPKGPSQVTSPRTTPTFVAEKDGWDLIYAAAGQVARLKMSGEGPPLQQYQHGRGLLGAPRSPLQAAVPPVKNPSTLFHSNEPLLTHSLHSQRNQLQQLKHELLMNQQVKLTHQQNQFQQHHHHQILNRGGSGRCVGFQNGRCSGRPLGLPQSAWPPLQTQQQNQHQHHQQHNRSGMRAVFLGGSGDVKRECAGTGVFLPRQYNNPTEPRRKPGCSTALLPAKVVQALNLNFEDVNAHSQPRFHGGFASDHDVLMARRNALLTQQKRSVRPEAVLNHEISLPQEWTY